VGNTSHENPVTALSACADGHRLPARLAGVRQFACPRAKKADTLTAHDLQFDPKLKDKPIPDTGDSSEVDRTTWI